MWKIESLKPRLLPLLVLSIACYTGSARASSLQSIEEAPQGMLDTFEDASGNFYYAGQILGTMDVDFGAGVHQLTEFADVETTERPDGFVAKFGLDGSLLWARQFANIFDLTFVVDDSGGVYISARFERSTDADPGEAVVPIEVGAFLSTVLIKLNADGLFQWKLHIGNGIMDNLKIEDLAFLPGGNLVGLGIFEYLLDIDPGPERVYLDADNGSRLLLQVTPEGSIASIKQLEVPYRQLHVDKKGDLVLLGSTGDDWDIDPGAGELYLLSYNTVVKLDAEANLIWAGVISSSHFSTCMDIALDSSDNIYAIGDFTGASDFDPTDGEAVVDIREKNAIFLSKLNGDGDVLWVRTTAECSSNDYPTGTQIAFTPNGDVLISGDFSGTADFDGTQRESLVSAVAREDVYLARFTAQGELLGHIAFGSSDIDHGRSLFSGQKKALLTGRFQSIISMQLEDGVYTSENFEGYNTILFTFDADRLCNPYFDDSQTFPHAADADRDNQFSLDELLRIIQFYNSPGYYCALTSVESEDGYIADAGDNHACAPHDADYLPQDWAISLDELLRVIQFYNSLAYHYCPDDATEDGFCPGPA